MVHVVGEDSRADADGPQEFIDVVARVARHPSEDNQHVVDVKRLRDAQRKRGRWEKKEEKKV